MKVTSFHPLIVSPDAEDIVKLFEELGFETRHTQDNVDNKDITNVTMKDANGFCVDVASVENFPTDLTIIRMNVDDFDEAYEMLIARGFKNSRGDQTIDSSSSRSAMMISPSGFAFDLCQHIK